MKRKSGPPGEGRTAFDIILGVVYLFVYGLLFGIVDHSCGLAVPFYRFLYHFFQAHNCKIFTLLVVFEINVEYDEAS